MGWLDDYEAAAGVQAKPQEPAKAAGGFLDEYDAARPTGLLEGAGQVGAKFGRGLAETAASAIQGVGIGLEATGATSMSGANLGQAAQDFAAQVREYAAQALPEVERLRDSFLLSSAPEALGSAVGFLLPGGWLKAAGVPAWATTMGLGAAVQGASQFEDARMHGASEEDQWKAYLLGGFVGTSEVLPLSRILTRADKASGGTLRETLVHGLIEGGEEFLQESGTQLASNAIASHVLAYDEDRKILEDVLANGTAGGFAGIVLSALASASAHSLGKKQSGKVSPSDGGAEEAEGRALPEVLPSSEAAAGPAVHVGPSEGAVLPAVPEGNRPGAAPESGGPGVGAPVPPDADQRGGQAPEAEAGALPAVSGTEDVGLPPSTEGGAEGAGGPVVRGEGEAEGGGVPVRPAPSGGAASEEAAARGTDGGTYAHTEEPAANFDLPARSELGPVEALPVESLRLTQLERFRQGVDEERVAALMGEMVKGRPLPPVTAMRSPSGELVVLDGHHRVVAAKELGFPNVPVRMVGAAKPKPSATPKSSPPAEQPRVRTADVVDSMRQIVTEFERDVGLEDADELPAALQLADRVLAQRAAAGKKSELDEALGDLLKAVRISPEEEFGSRRERALTDYTQAALKQAKTMLAMLDKVKVDVAEQRRRAGDQPGPGKEPGKAVAPAPVPDAPAPARITAAEEMKEERPDAPEVAQPTAMKRVRFETQTLSGPKMVTATLYELPGYKGPQLAVHVGAKGASVYMPKSGALLETSAVQGGNIVGGLDGLLKRAVARIRRGREHAAGEKPLKPVRAPVPPPAEGKGPAAPPAAEAKGAKAQPGPARFTHYTLPERAQEIRSKGWRPTGLSPYRADEFEALTWYPENTLFLSLDPKFWGRPQQIRKAKGRRIYAKETTPEQRKALDADPTARQDYDYERQDYFWEVGSHDVRALEGLEFELDPKARRFVVADKADVQALETIATKNGAKFSDGWAQPPFWEAVRKAYDIVEIRNADVLGQRDGPKRDQVGGYWRFFEQMTADQLVVLNPLVARLVETTPAPGRAAPPKTEPEKRESAWSQLARPASLVLGGPADIELANGKTLPAHYAIVEADDLIPSHDARRGFARNLSGDLNERDYADPVEGKPFRETVERIAKDLKRRILLSDTPTPTDGPPIVTSKGVVLGGNARAQAIQLAYARGTAQQVDFGGAVRQAAIQRGVPVEQMPRTSRHPVLVRVVADGSEGAPGELSRILNESLTTAKGATTEAVSRGALVSPQAATEIAGALGGGTLRDALGDPSRAKTILRALVSSGAFTQGDLVELTDPTKGTPTQAGKQVIEDALLGAVITDVRVLSETPPAVRQTIIRALPALVRIKVHHPAIAGVITRAAQGMATLKESGQPLADALGQQTLPGVDVGWKGDRLAVAIMRSMVDEAPTKVAAHFQEAAERIEDYAGGQASLFTGEDLAPAQRLEREFGITQAEKAGIVEEDEDIDDEPSDGAIVADPGELPPEMRLGYPADPVLGGGANIGAPIGGRLLGSLKPAPSVKGKVSLPEIVEALSKVVEAAGGKTPIRWGRLGTRNARGIFKVGPEVIRVKQANNVSTAAHEVGHALEKHILGWQAKGPWRKPLVTREQQKELVDLGKALYGNTKPQGGYKREGFAEFVRLYTMEPPSAVSSAPKFHAWFESEFLKDRPKVKAELLRVRELAETWRLQGSVARAEASIVEPTSAKEKLKRARAQFTANAAIEAFVEVGRPLSELAREAERRMGRLLTPKEDPFLLFQALRSTHSARTKQMIESGMIDLAGNQVGPALEQIRPLVKGRYQDFLLYLWGKRAVALITDPKGGREPGLSIQDARELVSEFDSPEFQRAAQMVYDWSDGILNYAAQASPDMAQAVEKIRDRDPGAYIPLQREFDELDSIWGEAKRARGVGSGGGSVAKRLKGSGRRIKNPFPVLLANAEHTVLAAHRRMVFDSIFKLSRIEGLGHMVEEVPVDQVPHAAGVEQLIRRLRKEHGVDVVDQAGSSVEPEDFAGEVITFFSPAQFPKGQDPVLPRWVDGQVKWYRLNHKVAALLAGMDVYRLPKVADLVLGVPARAMRLGTTGLRASFGLITNPLRDFQVLYQNSRSSAWAPRLFLEWVRQVGLAGLHHASGGKWTSPYIQAFLDLGGEMAQPLGQDMDHTARAARRLFQGQTVRVVDPRNLLDFVRQLLQFPETAARVAELKLLAKDIGWEPGQPMSFDQSLRLLMAAKQVTVDFTAAGSLGRVMNQIAPFHNAPIQGARGTVRAARNKPGQWLFRGLQITSASLALWWLNKDEEWYRELDARGRALFWAIPFTWNGKQELALIPKAQEGPQFFGSMPEALADAWYRQDPRGAREFFGVLFDTMAPNVWPVAVEEAYEQRGNEDRFWGTPIVPQGELRRPPEEQAGEYTSEVAKFLGELFGRSPRRIDHAIRGVFGGVAADVIDAVGLGGRAQKSGELSDTLVLGKLFQRGGPLGVRPRSINDLYDEIERADKVQASVRVEETPDQRQRRLMLEDAGQAVSALSYVRTQTSDNDKRRELTRKMVEISQRALEDAAKGAAPRGPMQQERKRAERLEKDLKQR